MAGLTIRGPHTNVRRGFFLIRVSWIFSRGAFFFPKKVDELFSRSYVKAYTARVQTLKRQHSVVKVCQLIGGPGGGAPPMVQRAQRLIRP